MYLEGFRVLVARTFLLVLVVNMLLGISAGFAVAAGRAVASHDDAMPRSARWGKQPDLLQRSIDRTAAIASNWLDEGSSWKSGRLWGSAVPRLRSSLTVSCVVMTPCLCGGKQTLTFVHRKKAADVGRPVLS